MERMDHGLGCKKTTEAKHNMSPYWSLGAMQVSGRCRGPV